MKIIFSNYDDIFNPFYNGGGAVAIHDIAKRLGKDHDVVVISGRHPVKKRSETVDGVNYKRIGFGIFGPQIDQLIYSLLLPFYVLKEDYSVWIESFIPPFSGSLNPLFAKKPLIGLAFFLDGESMQKKYTFPFAFFERLLIKNYQYIIATNTALREKIEDINPRINCAVIPIGIDTKEYQKKRKEEKILLYVGRIDIYNKGLDILMDIAPDILKKFPDYKIVIAGKGIKTDEKKLKHLIHEQHLEDKIILKGRVSTEEKIELMNQCTLFLSPSRYETFGITILEVLTCGKPSVIFDLPGFNWVPDGCCVKVEPFYSQKYKEAVIRLLEKPKERSDISEKAKRSSTNFDWRTIIGQYSGFINQVQK